MSVNEWKRGAANRSMQFIQFASIDECMNEERRAQPAHFMKFNEMSGKRDVITVFRVHERQQFTQFNLNFIEVNALAAVIITVFA